MAIDDAGRMPVTTTQEPPKASLLNDPKVRGILVQVLLIAALLAFAGWIINNTATNLQRANIASGFDFLSKRAGFEIGQSPVPYSPDRSYLYALYVGFLNTMVVAGIGITARPSSDFSSALAGCRGTGLSGRYPLSTWRCSATSRRCSSSCSGISG
jgi:ABC-type amino acid transport system permease subunit